MFYFVGEAWRLRCRGGGLQAGVVPKRGVVLAGEIVRSRGRGVGVFWRLNIFCHRLRGAVGLRCRCIRLLWLPIGV